MNNHIKIERIPYEEPYHIELMWNVSNGSTVTSFEYYDNADSLIEIADGLENFPRHREDVFLFEIGSERPEDNFAYYFRFRVFVTDASGKSAIQVRFCNNSELPYREIIEFCIQTEIAAINRLGNLFREFGKLEKEYMAWSDTDSFIGYKNEFF